MDKNIGRSTRAPLLIEGITAFIYSLYGIVLGKIKAGQVQFACLKVERK